LDTVAKYLIEELLSQGIDTFFGIPGGPVGAFFDALYRTPNTKLIEAKHETAAIFEAIGYYKTTGKVPVVLLTAGPGMTNSLTGIASAKALRIPILVIVGDTSWEKRNHILLQTGGPEGINIEHTFAPHSDHIIRIREVKSAVQQVISLLQSRTNLSPSIAIIPIQINSARTIKPKVNYFYSSQTTYQIDDNLLLRVKSLLTQAIHPLLIVGYGAYSCQLEIEKLINYCQVPFTTTPQAKGVISEDHPLSLRTAGIGASQWIREYVKQPPDVVLALGTDLDDCSIGTTELIDQNTKLIHIDNNSKVFNRKYPAEIAICCDLKTFCYDFKWAGHHFPSRLPIAAKQISPFDVADFREDDSFPIAPHRALADIEASIPSNARLLTDIGEHMLFCLHYLTIDQQKKFSIDLGLGSMGSGICQAIGMALGDKRPTICICGDGCFQMHGMEILTAIKEELPIVFAIFNDARYNMVSHGFNHTFGLNESPGQTNYIDFVKLAESLGILGIKIEQAGEISPALISGLLNKKVPSILDIRINKEIRIKGAGRNEVLKLMGE
jgi:acetolactate synthase-1/2/3 large subunit